MKGYPFPTDVGPVRHSASNPAGVPLAGFVENAALVGWVDLGLFSEIARRGAKPSSEGGAKTACVVVPQEKGDFGQRQVAVQKIISRQSFAKVSDKIGEGGAFFGQAACHRPNAHPEVAGDLFLSGRS